MSTGAIYALASGTSGIRGEREDVSTQPGRKNPNWKGGRTVASNGYVLLKMPGHHLADTRGYVYEHRLVAEQKLGRRLLEGEIPHHLNGDKTDNRPENIEVLPSRAHHMREHGQNKAKRAPGEPNPTISCACGCGGTLDKFDRSGRPRRFVSGHNMGGRRG